MNILVVKLSSLGDILHVLPTAHELRVQLGAEIDWVVHPEFAQLVRCFADVDGVIEWPRRHFLRDLPAAMRALRAKEYDLVVDLHGLFKSVIPARLARAKRRIAPSYARELSWLFFKERAGRMDRTRHAAEQAFDTLEYLGLKRPDNSAPSGRATSLIRHTDSKFQIPNLTGVQKVIAFAPVSRWESKNWPLENYCELARILLERDSELRIVVLGGKADVAAGEAISKAGGARVENFCGKTTIAQSFEVLSQCSTLIANDSGPVHMAATVGTKCIVLFGPTRPDWTGPYGKGHTIVMRDFPCQPCLKRECRRGDLRCLADIKPEEVADVFASARPVGAQLH